MALQPREWAVGVAGVLVLASGFMPWWVLRTRVGSGHEVHYGSAWRMSSRWSAAVLLTVLVVAIWLFWRLARPPVPALARLSLVAAMALPVYLSVDQVRDIEAWPPPGATLTGRVEFGQPDREPDRLFDDWMERDHLRSYHHPALYADVGWGLWVGLTGMVLGGAALAFARPATRSE